MKAINKFFYALLAFATVGMVACSEDPTHEPGAPELEGCYGVYFPAVEICEEQGPTGDLSLDPSEATVFTYTAYRENIDGEITVPVEVLSNTDDLYTVEPIVFEDGEDVATFTVTLSDKAEVGVPYTLKLSIENDPLYVKQYDTTNSTVISVTINRVKWIEVGAIVDEQGGKWCEFSEDMVAAWYGFSQPLVYPVKVQVRADSVADEEKFLAALEGKGTEEDLLGIYRVVNAYYPFEGVSGFTPYEAAFNIYVDGVDRVHIPLQEVGLTVNDGDGVGPVMIYSMVHYYLDNDATPKDEFYGSIRGGKITFPVQKLLGCPGGSYTGSNTYYVNSNGLWSLTIAPALGSYELVMPNAEEDGDFSFTEMTLPEGALFYSESQGAAWEPILEKGRCEVNTKDADRTFYSEYGILYRLPELYEAGYPIYFAAKEDGTVTLPTAYLVQNTGLVQNGYEVMMAIDAENSTFDPATGLLNLVAEFYVDNGEDAVTYGNFLEVISVKAPEFPVAPALDLKNDFSYTDWYTAPMESEFQQAEFDATLQQGVSYAEGAEAFEAAWGKAYCLPNLYTEGYNIYFTADADGVVSVPAGYELQPTGQYIYGKAAYMHILGGTCNEKTVVLNVMICDIEAEPLLPAVCTETIVNYTWVALGTGSYYSVLFGDSATQQIIPFDGLNIENAEGTNMYRIVNWLESGGDMLFTWDKTTNKCEIVGMVDTGLDSSKFGGTGVVAVCDARTCLAWMGVEADWERLELNGYVQPHFDPATLTFNFEIFYVFPDMGVGYMLNEFESLPIPFNEKFVLDGELKEVTWENVAVGTFTHTTDFFVKSTYLPYPQQNLALQRYGETNKYKIVGIGDAESGEVYNIEFTYDEATGAMEIPGQKTGFQYQESDGSMTDIYLGDAYAMLNDWGAVAAQGWTKEQVYTAYPNSYDAATKTYSFYLGYYDLLGYTYTSVDEGNPTVHTFQITGDAPAAQTASVASAEVKSIKLNRGARKAEVAPVNKLNSANLRVAKASSIKSNFDVKKATTLKTATPTKRVMMKKATL
ncbi:MAG: hypothetical protein IJX65_01830 [Alistipes sp.]|nr:hypothetical protein [Alistipes sp.]